VPRFGVLQATSLASSITATGQGAKIDAGMLGKILDELSGVPDERLLRLQEQADRLPARFGRDLHGMLLKDLIDLASQLRRGAKLGNLRVGFGFSLTNV